MNTLSARDSSGVPLAALVAAAVLALPLILLPQDWAGWVLLYVTLILPLSDPMAAADRRVTLAVLFTIVVHQLIALANAYWFTVPGAEYDAALFNAHAVAIADFDEFAWTLGSGFYENMLAAFYWLFGDSDLLGQELSVLAYTLSSLLFLRIVDRLGARRWSVHLVLLYGLLPATAVFTSLTMREPFELLLLLAAVYCGVRAWRGDPPWLAAAGLAAAGAGLFHAVLLAYAPVLVALLAIGTLLHRRRPPGRRGGWAAAVAGIGLLAAAIWIVLPHLDIKPGDDLFAAVGKGAVKSLTQYRAGIASGDPRTAFGVDLDLSSVPGAMRSGAVLYLHYLFAPFPWQIQGFKDVFPMLEALLRLALLVASGAYLLRGAGKRRLEIALLLLVFFSLTGLWAIGTTNYGQALRHHVLSNWLLLLTGGATLLSVPGDLWARAAERARSRHGRAD